MAQTGGSMQTDSQTLFRAAQEGDARMVQSMLKAGLDPNQKNSQDETPLVVAAMRGHTAVCKALVEGGASLASWDGVEALFKAAEEGNAEIARTILKAGTYPNHKNTLDETPLIVAARFGRADACKALVEGGASLDSWDEYGRSALHMAAEYGHAEVCRILGDAGADLEAADQHNMTPLHWAAKNGGDVCLTLIALGANPSAQSYGDGTPLHFASKHGNSKACELLVNAGADIGAMDQAGRLARDLAKDPDVASVLRAAHERVELEAEVKPADPSEATKGRSRRI